MHGTRTPLRTWFWPPIAFTAASVGRLASTLFNLLRDRALLLPDDRELLDEVLLGIALAHYASVLTSLPLLRAGMTFSAVIPIALASDSGDSGRRGISRDGTWRQVMRVIAALASGPA